MRKSTIKYSIIALIIGGVIYTAATCITSEAADANIGSKGNFVLEDGKRVAFYSEDINYLQRELEALFNEIK